MFNNFLLDGMDNNAYGESNQGFDNQIIAVPPDSVAQFQVVTNNENAEYGRSSGATINVASQSGTNRFHATPYEFLRNTDLNAAGFFKPPTVGNTGITSVQKTHLQSQPVRRQLRRTHPEGQALLLPRLRRLPPDPQAAQRADAAYAERAQWQPRCSGKEPHDGVVYPGQHADPNQRHQSALAADHQLLQADLRASGHRAATTGLASNDYAMQVPFTDHADKGDLRFDWQINPPSPRSSASATARRTA